MKRIIVLDVSKYSLNETYLFCKAHDRIYEPILKHDDGRSLLILEEKPEWNPLSQ